MGVSYIGFAAWLQVAEPEWTKMCWDISRASILFRGPRPGKTSFENGIADFESMPGYAGMRLIEYQSKNQTASFPAVEKMYVGFRFGVPQVKGTSSYSAQTARVSGVNPTMGNKVSATISYKASRTLWEWWETATPAATARYANDMINPVDPRVQITNGEAIVQIETEDGSTTVALSDLGTIINAAVPFVYVSDYTPEPIIPGAIWKCSATIDYKIRGS